MKRNNFTSLAIICFILFCICAIKPVSLIAQTPFPGTVVAESPDPLNNSYASPGIVVMPDGSYLVSHDITSTISAVYKSVDNGATWQLLNLVKDSHWSSLFYHDNAVYLLGVAKSFNNIVIHKSTDGGNSWTTSTDASNGVLLSGRFHTAPTPVVVHNGRIWKAFEESPDANNERNFHAFVFSAPIGADLLKASSWTKSTSVELNPSWFNADKPEWCEGNAVVDPDGRIVNIIRMSTVQPVNGTLDMNGYATGIPRYEVAAKLNVSADGQTTSFDPTTGFIHFPGAMTKFSIRYDAASGKYWSIVNKITIVFSGWSNNSTNNPYNQRNVLMLMSSTDLKNWQEHYKVIRWNEGDLITRRENFGFQYVDWQFEGNDIVAVSRTSWYGSDWHDANMITFHRLPNFRNLTMADSPVDLGSLTQSDPAVISWQFGAPATGGSEPAVNASYTNTGLNVSALSRGNGLNAASFDRSFSVTSKSQHNLKANAIVRDEYIQFEVQAKPGYSVNLTSIDAVFSRISNGPKSYRWAYSKDGTNFTEIGSGEYFGMVESAEQAVQPTIRMVNYPDLQNVPSTQKITFRLYIWGSTSSSGRFSIGRFGTGDTSPSLVIGGQVYETPVQEAPLVGWKFDTQTGTALNNKAAETNSTLLMTSSLTRGNGFTPANLNYGYYSTAPVHNKAEALIGNDFYEFSVQPQSGQYVSLNKLRYKVRRNSAGPVVYRWSYSVNDGEFIELGNTDVPFIGTAGTGYMKEMDLSAIVGLQNVASVHNIRFRLYAWGASTTSGGFGFARYTDDYCLALYGTTHENIVTAWQFDGKNGRQNNDPATTFNANIETSILTRGNGVTASESSINSFVGNFPVTTTKQQAIDNGNYFQFAIKPKTGNKVSLTSLDARIRVQENAPHHYCWRYSIDGVNFYDTDPADNIINTTVNNGQAVPQINLSNIPHLQNVTANKTITFRLYAWGGIATSTNSFGIGKSLSGANALIIGGKVEEDENPLPVKWGKVEAVKEGHSIRLKWNVFSEENHSHYNVLKSIDGKQFENIGSAVENQSMRYEYRDQQPQKGNNYYRVQQIDLDGQYTYSDVLSVFFSLDNPLFKIYYTTENNQLNLLINSEISFTDQFIVRDIQGKKLLNTQVSIKEGQNLVSFPLHLVSGIYMAELKGEVVKFVR
ncbi:hypothetical protein [Pseudopedobacter beijingensis]|uniref:Por secretion system C-terminal sorting domain-containing protein n=1 Tax=Pseudopedobacter beijingensis TaxID=1207056 RepID=A0ABW4IIA2_9SPHI